MIITLFFFFIWVKVLSNLSKRAAEIKTNTTCISITSKQGTDIEYRHVNTNMKITCNNRYAVTRGALYLLLNVWANMNDMNIITHVTIITIYMF